MDLSQVATDTVGANAEWWQLMLQYGGLAALVAVISTVALIIQNRQNYARDERRREDDASEREKDRLELAKDREEAAASAHAEREHQRQMAEIARDARLAELHQANEHALIVAARAQSAALDERWRDERRSAHLALLPIFEEAYELVRKESSNLRADDDGNIIAPESGAVSALDNEIRDRMSKAFALVQIIGSQRSQSAAALCQKALRDVDVRMWVATMNTGRTYSKKHIAEMVSAASVALAEYVSAVRSDLGTAG